MPNPVQTLSFTDGGQVFVMCLLCTRHFSRPLGHGAGRGGGGGGPALMKVKSEGEQTLESMVSAMWEVVEAA